MSGILTSINYIKRFPNRLVHFSGYRGTQSQVGSLRFWGEWFGRPYDNCHTLVSCRAEEDVLRLSFDQGETLSTWSPTGLTLDKSTSDADRVRWEWFSYGKAKTPENLYNLYFEEFK
jgi:hypothetical protein